MERIQITLTAIAVIAIVSLAMNIAILIRSGDGSTGSRPGQFGVEQVGQPESRLAYSYGNPVFAPQAVAQLATSRGEMANCRPGLGDNDVVPVPADLTGWATKGSPYLPKGPFRKVHRNLSTGTKPMIGPEGPGSCAVVRSANASVGRRLCTEQGARRVTAGPAEPHPASLAPWRISSRA